MLNKHKLAEDQIISGVMSILFAKFEKLYQITAELNEGAIYYSLSNSPTNFDGFCSSLLFKLQTMF